MSIWSKPPHGFTEEQRRERRRERGRAVLVAVVVVMVAAVGVRTNLLDHRPVTTAEALKAYRASTGSNRAPVVDPRDRRDDRDFQATARKRSATDDLPPGEVRRSGSSSTEAVPSAAGDQGSAPPSPAPAQNEETRPLDGVYEWAVEGYEETSGGVRRDLPRRSHRIITYGERGSWVEHHIFSDKREAWFEFDRSASEVVTHQVRNRVEFGPVEVDRTIKFDPAVVGARLPFRIDEAWSGSWKGRTEGEYSAEVFDHTFVMVEGERVEVWGTEVVMQMTGEVEGDVVSRSWFAPEYGMVVKQYQWMSVKSGPGGYETEWTGQVTSLTPAR